mgnify:FL=1
MTKVNLTNYERQIIEARSSGNSFLEMDLDEITWSIDQILVRGVAIYGCTVPESNFLAGFFNEEFSKFITEFGFSDYTLQEILLAMQLNCKRDVNYLSGNNIEPIPFTGHYFNVCFLSQILDNYRNLRYGVERKIQNYLDGY